MQVPWVLESNSYDIYRSIRAARAVRKKIDLISSLIADRTKTGRKGGKARVWGGIRDDRSSRFACFNGLRNTAGPAMKKPREKLL